MKARMSLRRAATALAAFGMVMGMAGAQAETVGGSYPSGTLYDSTTFVTGSSLNTATLNVTSAGKLSFGLTDMKWPEVLSSLSFSLSSATQVIGTDPSLAYQIDGPGTFFASVFAVGGAQTRTGLYNFNVHFAPLAPVPLPAAGLLLASSLAGFGAFRKKRLPVTSAA